MNMDLIANILAIGTVLLIGFWLVWRVGLMNRQGSSARKPMGANNENNERTELNEMKGRTGPTEVNEMKGPIGPTELNEMEGRNQREGDAH